MFFDLSPENSKQINSLLEKQTCVIFYYWNMCGHCHHVKPIWNEIVKKCMKKKNIAIINVEISNLKLLKAKCRKNINGVPTFIKYANGKKVDEFRGNRIFEELYAFVNKKII